MTGRTIKTGSIRLQILPTPRIKIHDVILGNAPGASKPEMVKVKSIEVILSLLDLLKGKIVVKSVDLNTPEINLEKDGSGKENWEFNLSNSKPEKENANEKPETVNAAAAGFVVHHLDISDATVNYIDQKEGSTKTFSNLNIECSSEELMGPYKLHIRTNTNTNRIDIEILTGILNLNGKTQVEATLGINLEDQKINLKLGGFVDVLKKQFTGSFKASSVDFPLTIELPHQKIDLRKSIDALGEIHATKEQLVIKNLNINHPVGQLVGLLNYNMVSKCFEANLKFKHQEDSINFQCSTKNFEDFEYHFSSSNYADIISWFTQNHLLKDRIDIKGIFKTEGNILNFKKTTVQIGDVSAEANVQFNTLTKQTSATSNVQNIQRWGHLFGHDLPVSGPLAATLNITPTKENLELSAKLSLCKGNVIFNGSVGSNNNFVKGMLTLEHINLSDHIINMKSNVLAKPGEIDLAIQQVEIKEKSGIDLAAGGKILIDLSKEKPHIIGSLTAQLIHLTAFDNDPIHIVRALYIPEMCNYQVVKIAANMNSRWTSTPIKLPLNSFTMIMQINIPKVTLGGLVFEALQSEITLNAGKLAVPFSAHMYGGKLNGALLVNDGKDQTVNLSAKFDGINIEKIQAAAAHFKQGKASGQIELKTNGNSQYDWVSNLHGQANFSVKDGIVKGFDLHEIVGLLKKPKNLLDLKYLQGNFSGKGETAFSNASGKFNVANGAASTNDLIIEAAEAQLKAQGQADLLNWQMQFSGEVTATTLKDLPPLKFTIKGPLDRPNYNLDLKQLQQLFLQKSAGDLVSKTLGKAIPGLDKIIPGFGKNAKSENKEASNSNTSSEDSSKEEAPLKADKVVKGLLKGIFG